MHYWVQDDKRLFLLASQIKIMGQNDSYQLVSQGIPQLDNIIAIGEKRLNKAEGDVDPKSKQGIADLMQLDLLNTMNILHTLRVRYYQNNIYTKVGSMILVSINPYFYFQELYSEERMQTYKENANHEPHIFKIGQEALKQLKEKSSSIIISGESGAGKSEAMKATLRYLSYDPQRSTEIEKRVFRTTPIFEATGNAKTARNDNSSRFGKFISLNFNAQLQVENASIQTYILEKSRVTRIGPLERNYHIFYQLIEYYTSQREPIENIKLVDLKLEQITYFKYLKKGDLNHKPENESQEFVETIKCLQSLNFTDEEINLFIQTIAGILYLGNVKIKSQDQESTFLLENNDLQLALQYLGLPFLQLQCLICNFAVYIGKQKIQKNNKKLQAKLARDSVSKFIYQNLFDWILEKIQKQLGAQQQKDNGKRIGLLDIFGFEIFEEQGVQTNTFEQLNINFTNERLQEHFNKNVIVSEQIIYEEEGIDWNQIPFPDNTPIIKLIENQVFLKLNDACKSNQNDEKLLQMIKKDQKDPKSITDLKDQFYYLVTSDFINNQLVQAKISPSIKQNIKAYRENQLWFGIQHYAGTVIYQITGFVDKNQDKVNSDIFGTFSTSSNKLLQYISAPKEQKSVIQQFQIQLKSLFEILNSSRPFYIKCIKPNDNKKYLQLDEIRVDQQLYYSGVMEAVKIRKAGYENKQKHQKFININYFLKKDIDPQNIGQSLTKVLLELGFNDHSIYQVGKTCIFYKKKFQQCLDKLLVSFMLKSTLRIQKSIRLYLSKKRLYAKLQEFRKQINITKWFVQRIKEKLRFRVINKVIFTVKKIVQLQRIIKIYSNHALIIRGKYIKKWGLYILEQQTQNSNTMAIREMHEIHENKLQIENQLALEQQKTNNIELELLETTQQKEDLEQKVAYLQKVINDNQIYEKQQNDQISQLNQKILAQKQNLLEFNNQKEIIEKLTEKIKSQQETINEYEQEIEQFKYANQNLELQMDSALTRSQRLSLDLNQQANNKKQLNDLQFQNDNLASQLKQKEIQIDDMSLEIKRKNIIIQQKDLQIEEIESEFQELQTKYNKENYERKDNQSKYSQQSYQMQQLNLVLVQQQGEINAVKIQQKKLQEDRDLKQNKVHQLEAERMKLNVRLQSLTSQLEHQNQKLDEAQQANQRLLNQLNFQAQQQQEIIQKSQKMQDSAKDYQIDDFQDQINKKQQEITELQNQIEQLNGQFKLGQQEKQKLQEQVTLQKHTNSLQLEDIRKKDQLINQMKMEQKSQFDRLELVKKQQEDKMKEQENEIQDQKQQINQRDQVIKLYQSLKGQLLEKIQIFQDSTFMTEELKKAIEKVNQKIEMTQSLISNSVQKNKQEIKPIIINTGMMSSTQFKVQTAAKQLATVNMLGFQPHKIGQGIQKGQQE
ncbi:hypothetical protein pb186bvf_004233 [Paramecium bursaria]